jgi:NADPH-dependent 2,4-dienoyl-CoA reductase/sulfur reductase-like enzyme
LIVGGGLAGQRCAETLRRSGYEQPIVMVCAEPHLPYDRPPLSKDLLFDGAVEELLSFRSAGWYEEQACPAVAIRIADETTGEQLFP